MRTYRFSDKSLLPQPTQETYMASFHYQVKTGRKGSAADHSDYINRTGGYRTRTPEQVTARGHGNMPQWASSPREFWRAADAGERANGAAYREVVAALPNELDDEQNLDLVHSLIHLEAQARPYQYAVHRPTASLGECPQPHVHLMCSDRIDDGLTRQPAQFFSRFNSEDPSKGGVKKASGGKDRFALGQELVARRKRFADLQNESLEKAGHATRVDHRSNAARGLVTQPEAHLGPAQIRRLKQEAPETLPVRSIGKT